MRQAHKHIVFGSINIGREGPVAILLSKQRLDIRKSDLYVYIYIYIYIKEYVATHNKCDAYRLFLTRFKLCEAKLSRLVAITGISCDAPCIISCGEAQGTNDL
jgi:hypothetical protein